MSFPETWKNRRVALAHDWLTGMRGGERVLELLCRGFPGATVYTLLCRPEAVSGAIREHPVRTSWLQRVPAIHRHYRYWLPFFPSAVAGLRPRDADLLVSTSHCVAKAVRRPAGAKHLCYCFTPMRYAWLFYEEYFGTNPVKKAALAPVLARLRDWDKRMSDQVDRFVTLSRHVRSRIQAFYGREADVVYPPVDTDYFTPSPEPRADYDLIVSALVPYKRVDLAVRAYTRLGFPLKVCGVGTDTPKLRAAAGPNVEFLGGRSDEQVRDLYRNARLLVFPGEEDFGIVPVEAQACGRPVVAYRRGGAMETIVDGRTGLFFEPQTETALLEAVEEAAARRWDPVLIRRNAERFHPQRFVDGLDQALAAMEAG